MANGTLFGLLFIVLAGFSHALTVGTRRTHGVFYAGTERQALMQIQE